MVPTYCGAFPTRLVFGVLAVGKRDGGPVLWCGGTASSGKCVFIPLSTLRPSCIKSGSRYLTDKSLFSG